MSLSSKLLSTLVDYRLVSKVTFGKPERLEDLGGLHYCATTLEIGGKIISGHAVDANPFMSRVKSLAEAAERDVVLRATVPIAASAAHWSQSILEGKLLAESLERDSLIRWSLGLIHPVERHDYASHSEIVLPSADSKIKVVVAFTELEQCFAFGSGADVDMKGAVMSARNEMAMSLIRHRRRNCGEDLSSHGILHRRITKSDFKKALVVRKDPPPVSPEYSIRFDNCKSALKWPFKVAVASVDGLFVWNSKLFAEENWIDHPKHPSAIYARSLGIKKPAPILAG